jgi:hypothetical protein
MRPNRPKVGLVASCNRSSGHYEGVSVFGGRLMTATVDAESIAVDHSYTLSETTVDDAGEAGESETPKPAPLLPATATDLLSCTLDSRHSQV